MTSAAPAGSAARLALRSDGVENRFLQPGFHGSRSSGVPAAHACAVGWRSVSCAPSGCGTGLPSVDDHAADSRALLAPRPSAAARHGMVLSGTNFTHGFQSRPIRCLRSHGAMLVTTLFIKLPASFPRMVLDGRAEETGNQGKGGACLR